MITTARLVALVSLLLVKSSCQAFVGGRTLASRKVLAQRKQFTAATNHLIRPLLDIRGGSSSSSPPPAETATQLDASMGDYTDVARSLFGNFVTPATLLVACLVPITLQELPLASYEKNTFKQKLKGIYHIVSLLATCSELICIVYATIASARLLETAGKLAPAKSALDLIRRDYELAWIATTMHFIGGLMGFLVASGIGAYLSFPKRYNTAGASFSLACLLWVIRLANTRALGLADSSANVLYLLKRYIALALTQLRLSRPNVVGVASVALTCVSIVLTIRALVSSEDE